MCDHHNKAVFCNFLEKLHDLQASRAVKSTGRLVREHDIRIVHQSACYRDPLHLAAGKLHRELVDMLGQADFSKSLFRSFFSLGRRHAANDKRELHILKNSLVRDQVIALEHEAYRVVSVRIPVTVAILRCRDPVYHELPAVRLVQAADNIQERRLSRSARAEHRHELIVAEVHAHSVQRHLRETCCPVFFFDIFYL